MELPFPSRAHEDGGTRPQRRSNRWAMVLPFPRRFPFPSSDILRLFWRMRKANSSSRQPGRHGFISLLKACMKLNDSKQALDIHAAMAESLETDVMVGSCLVCMYGRFGLLDKAKHHFDKLPVRDLIAWTSLIQGYAQHGCGEDALRCFEMMQVEGVCSDPKTYACALRACGSSGSMAKGEEMHAKMAIMGLLEEGAFVGSSVVSMYAKCGSLAKARAAFDRLPLRNVVTWTALIKGYADNGLDEEAFGCLGRMQREGISPDGLAYICASRICSKTGDVGRGKQIHVAIESLGSHPWNPEACNALIDMYAKCGSIAEAQQAFDAVESRDAESWNALMLGYSALGNHREAIDCFALMGFEGVPPSPASFVRVLKACSAIGSMDMARELCAEVEELRWSETDPFLGSIAIHVYATSGFLAKARHVFDALLVRNAVTWNAIIAGYAECGHGEEARKHYAQMKIEGAPPDAATFVCILKACASEGEIGMGREIHAELERRGLLGRDLVGNTLVDMYGKCGLLAEARRVFAGIPAKNAVSWTALIAGCVENGRSEEAMECLEEMRAGDIDPDSLTYLHALRACGSAGARRRGEEMHAEIERRGLLRGDLGVANVLVRMYAKCGSIARARQALDGLAARDAVSWNALIAGYVELARREEAVECFERMKRDGVPPDAATLVCMLKCCAGAGAAGKGAEIHSELELRGCVGADDPFVASALVDMYAKCGLQRRAEQVFEKLRGRDRVAWNALIAGYARIGRGRSVFDAFARMLAEGVKPDELTFLALLSACRSLGSAQASNRCLEAMGAGYGVAPTVDHYVCCVHLLSRLGQFDEALAAITRMPCSPNLAAWLALLDSCRFSGNLAFGFAAFEHATHLDAEDAVAYVSMCHMYAERDAGRAFRLPR